MHLSSILTQVEKYWLVPAGKHLKSVEHGSSIPAGNFPDDFRPEYCFHLTPIFYVFLQDTLTFPSGDNEHTKTTVTHHQTSSKFQFSF
jgi:hypothetical protein